MAGEQWSGRNADKPHRCPECHAVCTWDHKKHGPRTVLRCCGLKWRVSYRKRRDPMRWRWINGGEYSKPYTRKRSYERWMGAAKRVQRRWLPGGAGHR